MPTGARRRRHVDVERMAEAVERPGIDPRTWVSAARIDDPAEAVRWESDHGWIVDVTFYGSGLDQEREVPCRVLSTGPGGDGFGEFIPPAPSCEVAVVIPDGELDAGPVLLGSLRNAEDCKPPVTINGLPILGDAPASVPIVGPVSPADTEIKRSPHNRREQYDGDHVLQAQLVNLKGDVQILLESALVSLLAGQVVIGPPAPTPSNPVPVADIKLGGDTAVEPALLGTTTNANTLALLNGLIAMATTFSAMTGPLAPFQAVGTALLAVLNPLVAALPAQLAQSVKVK